MHTVSFQHELSQLLGMKPYMFCPHFYTSWCSETTDFNSGISATCCHGHDDHILDPPMLIVHRKTWAGDTKNALQNQGYKNAEWSALHSFYATMGVFVIDIHARFNYFFPTGILATTFRKKPAGEVILFWGSLCTMCGLAYGFARVYHVVKSFISLRQLAATAYQTPDWSAQIPHL
ncbi:hypothetical protein, variant [Exophiala oligosperma]|uniref:Uncharacterized protein n=1 Tax=Exophiala oligosperma TaxID=215243 RepID=A0A0D2E7H4_9EURO|nr:uncharacterized protein PV06_04842 [Exophiala oligosperma]XP_016263991.1 hypothetical protein, variant [Exophiala oligosperma]KIW43774.1 hypothetical protein PV06_04842 [Exophiala oligosperma]KIW43775.1 hypothetical protein, variant [Exophiala oligosperma]